MPEKCKATNAFLVNWFCFHVSHLFSPSYTFFLSSVFWLKKHTNSVKRLLRQIQNIKLSVVYFFAHLNKNILFNYRNLKKQVNACLVHLCCLCQTCNCIISFGNDIILRYCLALYKFIYILNDSAYIRTYIYIAIERKNNKSSPFCKKTFLFLVGKWLSRFNFFNSFAEFKVRKWNHNTFKKTIILATIWLCKRILVLIFILVQFRICLFIH